MKKRILKALQRALGGRSVPHIQHGGRKENLINRIGAFGTEQFGQGLKNR
jgi:hypothetical protein